MLHKAFRIRYPWVFPHPQGLKDFPLSPHFCCSELVLDFLLLPRNGEGRGGGLR